MTFGLRGTKFEVLARNGFAPKGAKAPKGSAMSNVITIDNESFDLDTIPQGNKYSLMGSAIGHKVRNEAASKVRSALLRDALAAKRANGGGEKAELTDEEAKAVKFDSENADHIAAYRVVQKEIGDVIRTGEIGASRASGPRLSEPEKRGAVLVRNTVLGILQKSYGFWLKDGKPIKNKFPTRTDAVTFSDGVKREFGEMCDSYYAKNKVAIDRLVAKQMEDEAKAAERAAKAVEGTELPF